MFLGFLEVVGGVVGLAVLDETLRHAQNAADRALRFASFQINLLQFLVGGDVVLLQLNHLMQVVQRLVDDAVLDEDLGLGHVARDLGVHIARPLVVRVQVHFLRADGVDQGVVDVQRGVLHIALGVDDLALARRDLARERVQPLSPLQVVGVDLEQLLDVLDRLLGLALVQEVVDDVLERQQRVRGLVRGLVNARQLDLRGDVFVVLVEYAAEEAHGVVVVAFIRVGRRQRLERPVGGVQVFAFDQRFRRFLQAGSHAVVQMIGAQVANRGLAGLVLFHVGVAEDAQRLQLLGILLADEGELANAALRLALGEICPRQQHFNLDVAGVHLRRLAENLARLAHHLLLDQRLAHGEEVFRGLALLAFLVEDLGQLHARVQIARIDLQNAFVALYRAGREVLSGEDLRHLAQLRARFRLMTLIEVHVDHLLTGVHVVRVQAQHLLVDGDRLEVEAAATVAVGSLLEEVQRLVALVDLAVQVADAVEDIRVVWRDFLQLQVLVEGFLVLLLGEIFVGGREDFRFVDSHRASRFRSGARQTCR